MVSNAGGINPHACAKAIHDVAKKSGVEDLKIAVVTGDNLIGQVKINQFFCFLLLGFLKMVLFAYYSCPFYSIFSHHKIDETTLKGIKELESGQSLPEQVHSMNAYIG